MGNIQLKAFRQLNAWQTGLMLFAGVLLGMEIFGPWGWLADYIDLETQNLILLGIIALIVAVAQFCTIVCHELYEINDQLAGRSPELKEWLGKR